MKPAVYDIKMMDYTWTNSSKFSFKAQKGTGVARCFMVDNAKKGTDKADVSIVTDNFAMQLVSMDYNNAMMCKVGMRNRLL